MYINEESKVIFLHNPRCGGTYFRRICLSNGKRAPYWSDYSEETNVDMAHISLRNLSRFIPDYKDYKIISFIRNPYNRFVSALTKANSENTESNDIFIRYGTDVKKFCQYLCSLNYYDQDMILRNQAIPWLLPQSNFSDVNTLTLRYESLSDWNFLFNIFNISGATVNIKEDYELDRETMRMIRELYFDDEEIFCLYDKK